jgi:hypothetical protein
MFSAALLDVASTAGTFAVSSIGMLVVPLIGVAMLVGVVAVVVIVTMVHVVLLGVSLSSLKVMHIKHGAKATPSQPKPPATMSSNNMAGDSTSGHTTSGEDTVSIHAKMPATSKAKCASEAADSAMHACRDSASSNVRISSSVFFRANAVSIVRSFSLARTFSYLHIGHC